MSDAVRKQASVEFLSPARPAARGSPQRSPAPADVGHRELRSSVKHTQRHKRLDRAAPYRANKDRAPLGGSVSALIRSCGRARNSGDHDLLITALEEARARGLPAAAIADAEAELHRMLSADAGAEADAELRTTAARRRRPEAEEHDWRRTVAVRWQQAQAGALEATLQAATGAVEACARAAEERRRQALAEAAEAELRAEAAEKRRRRAEAQAAEAERRRAKASPELSCPRQAPPSPTYLPVDAVDVGGYEQLTEEETALQEELEPTECLPERVEDDADNDASGLHPSAAASGSHLGTSGVGCAAAAEEAEGPLLEVDFEKGSISMGFAYLGARVEVVEPSGQADRLGVRVGDRIVAIGGKALPAPPAYLEEVQASLVVMSKVYKMMQDQPGPVRLAFATAPRLAEETEEQQTAGAENSDGPASAEASTVSAGDGWDADMPDLRTGAVAEIQVEEPARGAYVALVMDGAAGWDNDLLDSQTLEADAGAVEDVASEEDADASRAPAAEAAGRNDDLLDLRVAIADGTAAEDEHVAAERPSVPEDAPAALAAGWDNDSPYSQIAEAGGAVAEAEEMGAETLSALLEASDEANVVSEDVAAAAISPAVGAAGWNDDLLDWQVARARGAAADSEDVEAGAALARAGNVASEDVAAALTESAVVAWSCDDDLLDCHIAKADGAAQESEEAAGSALALVETAVSDDIAVASAAAPRWFQARPVEDEEVIRQ